MPGARTSAKQRSRPPWPGGAARYRPRAGVGNFFQTPWRELVQKSWACRPHSRIFCDTVSDSYKRKTKAIPETYRGELAHEFARGGTLACGRAAGEVWRWARPRPTCVIVLRHAAVSKTARPPAKAQSEAVVMRPARSLPLNRPSEIWGITAHFFTARGWRGKVDTVVFHCLGAGPRQ
jgi:hypothetical protein